jgi:hypothetical protein
VLYRPRGYDMGTKPTSPVGTYVYERGGFTNNEADGAKPVDHFAFCSNCEREVPVDSADDCMYCFHPVIEENGSDGDN